MIRRKKSVNALSSDSAGAAAVEFALIAPVIIMMIVGGMYTAMLGYTASSLHFAVEAAARCRSVNTSTCTNDTTTETFANTRFTNVTGNPATFVASPQVCGNRVVGSVTFDFEAGITRLSVPLAATACFP